MRQLPTTLHTELRAPGVRPGVGARACACSVLRARARGVVCMYYPRPYARGRDAHARGSWCGHHGASTLCPLCAATVPTVRRSLCVVGHHCLACLTTALTWGYASRPGPERARFLCLRARGRGRTRVARGRRRASCACARGGVACARRARASRGHGARARQTFFVPGAKILRHVSAKWGMWARTEPAMMHPVAPNDRELRDRDNRPEASEGTRGPDPDFPRD
jgi:hypothetical protein